MITIVGGTYDEFCFEPYWKERYGSGLRACRAIQALNPNIELSFHTFGDPMLNAYLDQVRVGFPAFQFVVEPIPKTILFHYDHPLRTPQVFPRPDTLEKGKHQLQVLGEQVLSYGFLEGSAQVRGGQVVYDPQSPVQPVLFSQNGSTAEVLAYVINIAEARKLSGKEGLDAIKQFFFEVEKAAVLIIKMGPKGAMVVTREGKEELIPVYQTEYVWPIGSGDVFAATFAYQWFHSGDVFFSAHQASWLTAEYCNNKNFQFSKLGTNPQIKPLEIEKVPTQKVYLAGPFFTFAQRWLIDQIRSTLMEMRIQVFSPWHDVGHGVASEVVGKDLEALESSGIVFAVLDGLDSGTLFEIGYAVHKGIPVIGYVENESTESIKMLEGTNCILERDLTTAIYKCFWKMAQNG